MDYGLKDYRPPTTKEELEKLRTHYAMPSAEVLIQCDCPYRERAGARFYYAGSTPGTARLRLELVEGSKRRDVFTAVVYELGCAVMQIHNMPGDGWSTEITAADIATRLIAKALVNPGVVSSGGMVKFGLIEAYPYLRHTKTISAFKDAGFTAAPFNGQHGSDLCLLYYVRHGKEKM